MAISFEYSLSDYKMFDEKTIAEWIILVIKDLNYRTGDINYFFVTEEEILELNQKTFNHDYFTDIITFDDVFVNIINADIFISLETVKSNSQKFDFPYKREIFRVIIHGIMHLCGFKDKSLEEKATMRRMEDKYLDYLEIL